jgi:hypothetical protein
MLLLRMLLRNTNRKKDGKEHRYSSVVENRRVAGGRTAQRTVFYLGDINDRKQAAWRKKMPRNSVMGINLLRSNLTGEDPAGLSARYVQRMC